MSSPSVASPPLRAEGCPESSKDAKKTGSQPSARSVPAPAAVPAAPRILSPKSAAFKINSPKKTPQPGLAEPGAAWDALLAAQMGVHGVFLMENLGILHGATDEPPLRGRTVPIPGNGQRGDTRGPGRRWDLGSERRKFGRFGRSTGGFELSRPGG